MIGEKARSAESTTPTDERAPGSTPWLLGFLCLLIPMLPSYSVFPGPLKSNGSPAKMLGVLLFFLVVLGFVTGYRDGVARQFRPATAIFSLFFLINLLIYGFGFSHISSDTVTAAHTRVMLSIVASTGIALYTLTRAKLRDRHFLLGCLAISLTFNGIVALLHSQLHIDLRLLFQPPGFVENRTLGTELRLGERLGVLRAQGTANHPIEFSVLVAASVPITIYFSRFARSRGVRILATLATPVNVLALTASISRTGIIALITGLLILMWAFPLRKLATGVFVGAAVLVGTVAATPKNVQALWDTVINSSTDTSVLERIADYPRVSQTLREHPLFGLGLGGAEPSEYGFTDNQWLQQLVTGGLFGFAAILLLTAAAVFGLSAALRTASDAQLRAQAYTISAAAVAIFGSSFTFDLFAFQQSNFLFFLMIALLWVDFDFAIPPRTVLPARRQALATLRTTTPARSVSS